MAIFYGILSFLVFVILLPVFAVLGLVLGSYRQLVKFYLKHKHGQKFKGLISGLDLLWTVGDHTISSIINMIIYTEFDKAEYDPETTPQTVLATIRRIYGNNMRKRKELAPKFFYKLQCAYGYSFWLDENPGPIEKYIRQLDFETDGDFVTQEIIAKAFSKHCNANLPDEHTRNWEFLVGNKVIDAGDKVKIPALCRISHIMGDGVTLMRLLLEVMADEPKSYGDEWDFWNDKQTSMCSRIKEKLSSIMNGIILIFVFPYYFFCDALRPSDKNVLHPERFSGEKNLYWVHETDADIPLLDTLKKIRRQYPGTRFNDVLLTMATKGIAKVLGAKSHIVPSIQAVMVERTSHESKELELYNKFTWIFRTLPIEETLKPQSSDMVQNFSTLLEKIKAPLPFLEIMVRDIVSQKINTILPVQILRVIFADFKITVAISVLPGLNSQVVLGGYEWKDMTFFLPNLSRIAIGLAVMTYGDKLHLSIQVDKAAISDETEVKMILDEILDTIRNLKEPLNL